MSVIEIVSLALVGLFLLVAVVRLFRKPLKLALRVVLNSALGLGVLWLLNSTAPLTVTVESQNRQETMMHTSTPLYEGPVKDASFSSSSLT